MLFEWLDMKGIIYYELLETGQTVNATSYFQQQKHLRKLKKRNGRKVIFLHDKPKPHVA